MDKLVELLRHYILRDANYMISGSILFISILHSFDKLRTTELGFAYALVAAGAAFVTSCALSEMCALIGIVTTARVRELTGIKKWMFKRFTGESWKDSQHDLSYGQILKLLGEHSREEDFYQRMVFLMHVGATNCCSFMVASPFLLVHALKTGKCFDWVLVAGTLALAGGCWAMNWIKASQRSALINRWQDELKPAPAPAP